MRVLIENFRCFKEKKLEFPNGNISLLKGESGRGKSTILQSIFWCLFGNLRNIYPLNFKPSSTNQTKVTLEFPGQKLRYIIRSQPPEQIKIFVQKDGTKPEDKDFDVLESEAAQRYIESVFGTKDIWYVSSYLAQGERSPLMTNSNSDKINLLCEILFGNKFNSETNNYDNPDWYSGKIEKQLAEVSSKLALDTAAYNELYAKVIETSKNYKPVINENGTPYWNRIPSEEELTEFQTKLTKLKASLNDINKKMLDVKGKEIEKEMLTVRMNELETKIKTFESMNSEDMVKYLQDTRESIATLETSIQEMNSLYLSLLAKEQSRDFLNNKLKELNDSLSRFDSNLTQSISLEQLQSQRNTKREAKTKLEYDIMNIKVKETELERLNNKNIEVNSDLIKITDKLSKFDNLNIEELRKQIHNTKSYEKLKEIQSREPENIEFNLYNDVDFETKISDMQRTLPLFISEYNKNYDICVKNGLVKPKSLTEPKSLTDSEVIMEINLLALEETIKNQLASVQQVMNFVELMKKELEIKDKHIQNDAKQQILKDSIESLRTSILNEETEISSIQDPNLHIPILNLETYITMKTEIQMNTGDCLQCPDCNSALELSHFSPAGPKLCKVSKAKYSKEEAKKRVDLLTKLSEDLKILKSKESELEYLQKEKSGLPIPKAEYITDQIQATYTTEVVSKYKKFYDEVSQFKFNVNNSYAKTSSEAEVLLATIPKVIKRKAWERDYEQAKQTLSIDDSLPILNAVTISKYERDIVEIPLVLSQQQRDQNLLTETLKSIQEIKDYLENKSTSQEIENEIKSLNQEIINLEDLYQKLTEYTNIKNKIENVQNELNAQPLATTTSNEVLENLNNLKLKCQALKETLSGFSQYEVLTQDYNTVKSKLDAIIIDESSESLASNFEAITKEISNIEIWISEGKQVYDIVKYSKELETNKISLFKQNAEQAYLNRLKMLIIEVTNSSLQNLVDSINECTNNVLEDLFENNIRVELKLFKEQKKTNNLKPVINFSIYYNNSTYDNIMGLSGGEKDRISLALTVALACVNPSPVLFLDECLSTVSNDLRECAIDAIKKFVIIPTKKTCIFIQHSSVEGIYDNVIEI